MPRLTYDRLIKSLTKLHTTITAQYPSGSHLKSIINAITESIVAVRAGMDGDATTASPGQIKHQLELRLNEITTQRDDFDDDSCDNNDSSFTKNPTISSSSPNPPSPTPLLPVKTPIVSKRRINATKAPSRVSKRTTPATTASLLPPPPKINSPPSEKEHAAATALLCLLSSSPSVPHPEGFLLATATQRVNTFTPLPDIKVGDSKEKVFFQGVQYAMTNLKGGMGVAAEAELQDFVWKELGLRPLGDKMVGREKDMSMDVGVGGSGSMSRGFWDVV